MARKFDIAIIGGGAAGFFCAANLIDINPTISIVIIERGKEVLQKVKISGGGRCNVTHACWEPNELIKFYPRGAKELRGPFHKFCTGDTSFWFENRGVALKIEEDGRMFPVTDQSQTIIDCLLKNTLQKGVELVSSCTLLEMKNLANGWILKTSKEHFQAEKVLIAGGSSKSLWELLEEKGHKIIAPVPSLFTFNTKDIRLKDLAGLSVPNAMLSINELKIEAKGPLLVTHWGLSGPGILRLSAWGAIDLARLNYKFSLSINFSGFAQEQAKEMLEAHLLDNPKKIIGNVPFFSIPKRLWQNLLGKEIAEKQVNQLSHKEKNQLFTNIFNAQFSINGKSTFKDEFVTAGGIELSEVDFRTMQSKVLPNVFFAGEVLNIDAITGGFNFQAAWTTAFLAAKGMVG